jgi:hypothetical protein
MANFPSTYFGVHSAFHAGYKYPYLFFFDITAAQNPKVTLYLQPHIPQKRAVTVLTVTALYLRIWYQFTLQNLLLPGTVVTIIPAASTNNTAENR